ncbi:hypothetical protein Nepgr_009346 [Nepenthes gracilis]|uniref:Uncharacterized protein n=1 Tax=Nepenthes gracilis TaxID=150966 RepID=A0AAD3SB54_NEPGR|nr:hypothetical protein Nepgr_009346 [Nepenthes gracilis]
MNGKARPQEIAKQPSSVLLHYCNLQTASCNIYIAHYQTGSDKQTREEQSLGINNTSTCFSSLSHKDLAPTQGANKTSSNVNSNGHQAQPTNSRNKDRIPCNPRAGRCNTPTAAAETSTFKQAVGSSFKHRSCITIIQPDRGLSQDPQSAEGTSPSPIPNKELKHRPPYSILEKSLKAVINARPTKRWSSSSKHHQSPPGQKDQPLKD